MNDGDAMAAELLAVSAAAYAAYASNHLLEKMPEAKTQFGESAFDDWKEYYCQRIKELSVAMAEKQPALFVSSVRWSRTAFLAREFPENLLRESLVCLGEVLEEELPDACRQNPTNFIASAIKSLEESEEKTPALDLKNSTSKLAMQYLLQVLEGDSQNAIKIVVDAHAHGEGLSIENAYQVLMTAQLEIGRMWHEGEINIAEEHVVTSTTERAMAVLAWKAVKQPPNGQTVVSAAVAGNTHEIGVRVLSDFFAFAGWRSICLGADLPAIDIAQGAKYFDSTVVLLSAALSTHLKSVRATVGAVREMNPNCKIMVGGTAFHDAPDIWRQLGADAFASTPADAVLIATELIEK